MGFRWRARDRGSRPGTVTQKTKGHTTSQSKNADWNVTSASSIVYSVNWGRNGMNGSKIIKKPFPSLHLSLLYFVLRVPVSALLCMSSLESKIQTVHKPNDWRLDWFLLLSCPARQNRTHFKYSLPCTLIPLHSPSYRISTARLMLTSTYLYPVFRLYTESE